MLIGVSMALYRRLTDGGALALQRFSNDILPLLLLFVVAASGLGLTISAHFMNGRGFPFIAATHAASVIILLLSLPFGKLVSHLPAAGTYRCWLLQTCRANGQQAHCGRCGEAFASQMHVDDLKHVFAELGMDAHLDGPVSHYQDICPPCRRRLLALNQGRTMAGLKNAMDRNRVAGTRARRRIRNRMGRMSALVTRRKKFRLLTFSRSSRPFTDSRVDTPAT